MTIAERIADLRGKIEQVCEKSGRDPAGVRIVGVAKGFPPDKIREVVGAGIREIGENYLQEGVRKQEALGDLPDLEWHFIGHLQQNKAFRAAERFGFIHAVDSWSLAETLNQAGAKLGKKIRALIQLKGNPGGFGLSAEQARDLADRLSGLDWVEWNGIMILPPPSDNPEDARPFFSRARQVLLELADRFSGTFRELSMGMTGDFQIAIEEGATVLRIGRAIFGDRTPKVVPIKK